MGKYKSMRYEKWNTRGFLSKWFRLTSACFTSASELENSLIIVLQCSYSNSSLSYVESYNWWHNKWNDWLECAHYYIIFLFLFFLIWIYCVHINCKQKSFRRVLSLRAFTWGIVSTTLEISSLITLSHRLLDEFLILILCVYSVHNNIQTLNYWSTKPNLFFRWPTTVTPLLLSNGNPTQRATL